MYDLFELFLYFLKGLKFVIFSVFQKRKRLSRKNSKSGVAEPNRESAMISDGKCLISSADQTKLNLYESSSDNHQRSQHRIDESNFVTVAQKDEQTMQLVNGN